MTFTASQTASQIDGNDPYSPLVNRVFHTDQIVWGDNSVNYLAKFIGRLRGKPEEAYDKLAASLKPFNVTPLFRKEKDMHAIILMSGVINPKRSNPVINLVLFVLTLLSVILMGTLFTYDGPFSGSLTDNLSYIIPALLRGLAFAASLLGILLAHEFGHYLAARYHHTAVSLPYFIPFPFSPFGTMGAFIQMKEPPKNKRILLDIGLAGPLAGLVVAIPVLFLGLYLSELRPLPVDQGLYLEGNSILYLVAKYIVHGEWLPQPVSYEGLHPIIFWIRYFFTGLPIPAGGLDVILHPVAFAGWAGLLVTALNLIPAGQLDGGHLIFVLLGKRARFVLPFVLTGLIALGTVWPVWWVWAFLIFMMGRIYAEPLDQITPLDPNRRLIAVFGLIVFVLVFIPIPIRLVGI
ncbi:MAG: site-2 protease family protein [Anaerolineales bacterium]|nr:site-2 protease family protein [Anaerolineales bacterium]